MGLLLLLFFIFVTENKTTFNDLVLWEKKMTHWSLVILLKSAFDYQTSPPVCLAADRKKFVVSSLAWPEFGCNRFKVPKRPKKLLQLPLQHNPLLCFSLVFKGQIRSESYFHQNVDKYSTSGGALQPQERRWRDTEALYSVVCWNELSQRELPPSPVGFCVSETAESNVSSWVRTLRII